MKDDHRRRGPLDTRTNASESCLHDQSLRDLVSYLVAPLPVGSGFTCLGIVCGGYDLLRGAFFLTTLEATSVELRISELSGVGVRHTVDLIIRENKNTHDQACWTPRYRVLGDGDEEPTQDNL